MENGVIAFLPLPIAEPLLAWYKHNARELPWRENTDAYRVWVSEIMLQQTRVEAVKPYFLRFMKALPDIRALADVPEETLLKLWEGLGYYSRARNLQRAAKLVTERHDGVLPSDMRELRALPGIDPYTAGAIASIAYGMAEPAVDGNVLRVLARLSGSELDIALPAARIAAEKAVRDMIPADDPGAFNQALMELGACVCLPNTAPRCVECPLAALCRAHREGRETELPVRSKKAARRVEEHSVFVLREHTRVAVRKRGGSGLLAGLWELPNLPGHMEQTVLRGSFQSGDFADWGYRAVCPQAHIHACGMAYAGCTRWMFRRTDSRQDGNGPGKRRRASRCPQRSAFACGIDVLTYAGV